MDDCVDTTDRDLVRAVLDEEPGAFEQLVQQHQSLCFHVIRKLVDDADDARELCQETFFRVHTRLHQYRFESALKTWIGRIAYSIALRHLEQNRSPVHTALTGEDAEHAIGEASAPCTVVDEVDRGQLRSIVHVHIQKLPPIQRMLIALYHLDELSIPEISLITDLPGGTIKSHLSRARARLRAGLLRTLGDDYERA